MNDDYTASVVRRRAPGGSAELWVLAYPLVVTTLSQSLMGVVDTLFMGRIGTVEQGAVGLAAVILWTLTSFFVGIQNGTATFAAQHFGAGHLARCGQDGRLALWLALPSGAALAGLAFASAPILAAIGTDEAVLPPASSYLFIRLAGAVFYVMNTGVVSFLRGVGDTRTPMCFSLGENVLNAIFNYGLILGNLGCPRLGAAGAALATVLATAASSAAYLAVFFTGRRHRAFATRRFERPALPDVRAFLKVGAPIGGVWALEMVSWAVFMAVVGKLGHVELAATNIVFQVLHFSFMGAVALSIAASTLVGQYLGAEDVDAARGSARTAILWAVSYCVAMGGVFLATRFRIVALFNEDPRVIELGARLFIYAAIFQFFDGLGISCTGVLRGASDTRWPMGLTVLLAWGLFIPLTYLFAIALGFGIDGAWIAMTVFIVALGVGLFARLRTGKWEGMRV